MMCVLACQVAFCDPSFCRDTWREDEQQMIKEIGVNVRIGSTRTRSSAKKYTLHASARNVQKTTDEVDAGGSSSPNSTVVAAYPWS